MLRMYKDYADFPRLKVKVERLCLLQSLPGPRALLEFVHLRKLSTVVPRAVFTTPHRLSTELSSSTRILTS